MPPQIPSAWRDDSLIAPALVDGTPAAGGPRGEGDEPEASGPAAAVVDSQALGKLYTSRVTLARFEADAGTTDRGNVCVKLNAVFGGERTGAAVRIAAA